MQEQLPQIAFRVDAAVQIGTGHFMRCLTLADELTQRGAQIRFVSRYLSEYLANLLEAKGYELSMLDSTENDADLDELAHAHWLGCSQAQDAQDSIKALSDRVWDWLVVDHYALDFHWESRLRQAAQKILAIDDLADRRHDCDVLLDQNYYRDFGQRYLGLVPEHCVTLLGPSYVLLRPEFLHAKRTVRVRNGTVQRILVFFGGSDLANQTQMAVEALGLLNRSDIAVDVVVGAANPCRNAIRILCDGLPNVTFHYQVSNMARLIQNADLGIGAGGAAMWERCFLGLPTLTVVVAANQERTTEDVASVGAIEYMGWYDQLGAEDYVRIIAGAIENPHRVKQIGEAALGILQTESSSVVDEMQRLI